MTQSESYSAPQIALHWLMALLIATNYLVSDGMEDALDEYLEGEVAVSGLTPAIHVYVGLAVLVLVALRLVLRLVKGTPAMPEATPTLMHVAAKWTHVALYGLLVAVPAFGALAWFGGVDVFGGLHVIAMNALMILAGLHAAAAIFHQFVLKDGLLLRMIRPS